MFSPKWKLPRGKDALGSGLRLHFMGVPSTPRSTGKSRRYLLIYGRPHDPRAKAAPHGGPFSQGRLERRKSRLWLIMKSSVSGFRRPTRTLTSAFVVFWKRGVV